MEWKFKQHEPGDPEREPHEEEFFRSYTELAEAVVREFIQNSLDARRDSRTKVFFKLGKIKRDKVKQYFDSLIPHIKACNLPVNIYSNPSISTIPFLIIEDFDTTGLDGRTGEDGSFPPKGNNFYDFWWREGGSGKSGQKAGRWGLGKTAFHIASLFKSFWGVTVRHNDSQELMLGKASLNPHDLNGKRYKYYGYFVSEEYNKPVKDRQFIHNFKQNFSVKRSKESGLSIIIPFPRDNINVSNIIKYVIIHYFYAILKGDLEVTVSEPSISKRDRIWVLNSDVDKLKNIVKNNTQSSENEFWKGIDIDDLLQFAQDITNIQDAVELNIADTKSPMINEDSFGDKITELKDAFNSGNLLAFKIPITIQMIGKKSSPTYFKIYIKKYHQLKTSEEFYIRSGITISNIKNLGNRPVRGILIAEDEIITQFLGDAETPAHTDWNPRTGGFEEKYEKARKILLFVRKSMKDIVSILDEPPKEIQKDFLKDVFWIPIKPPEPGEEDVISPPVPTIPPSQPPLFYIQKVDKGFKVSMNRKEKHFFPIKAEIKVAFDVRKGNPFKQYEPCDFDLGSKFIHVSASGCNVLKQDKNIMIIETTEETFNVQVTGFDPKRDLVINIKEVKNETQV